jgi:hypothetical protein
METIKVHHDSILKPLMIKIGQGVAEMKFMNIKLKIVHLHTKKTFRTQFRAPRKVDSVLFRLAIIYQVPNLHLIR